MPTLADYKAPYPEPTADQKRFVIFLDPKENEDDMYKLEIIPGRIENVDGANRHFMGGKLEEKTVQGWGYDYHVATLGPTAGTMMMPFGDAAEKKPRFVRSSAASIIRYNSKLPVVVYVPKDATLRYRVWTANGGAEGVVAEEH